MAADLPANPERAPVRFRYLTPEDYLDLVRLGPATVLAAIVHGDMALPAAPWPQIRSGHKPLEAAARVEVLSGTGPVTYDARGGFETSRDGRLFFACRSLADIADRDMASQAEAFYLDLVALVREAGYPEFLRIWNIVGDINGKGDGLERYRRFCLGRHEALNRAAPELAGRYPAASGVGNSGGGLTVYLLAAREPGRCIENPRQVSAFRYPSQYGPRSPSFARALVKAWDEGTQLFLSGTASIVGHETRHAGDLEAQVDETLANVRALVAAAERTAGTALRPAPGRAVFKAYLRRHEDYARVRRRLEQHLVPGLELLYLRADICRSDLLFEIDGSLFRSVPG